MSGITPILDTLLHEVLGRRADLPARQPDARTVTPVSPESPLPASRADSRPGDGLAPRGEALPPAAQTPARSLPPHSSPLLLQHQAHARRGSIVLSPAARLIGGLLNRFPAAPPALRPSAPLLPGQAEVEPAMLASRLRAGIGESGLFYESHLSRWYRGEMTRLELNREPQMRAPAGDGGADLAEPLQGLVRHQIELLASPVLRWEGDVWAGVFMALVIQPPPAQEDGRHAAGEGAEEGGGEDGWHSEVALEVRDLGTLRVRLRLREERLDLSLLSTSPEVLERMRGGRQALLERLRACGFAQPALHMALLDEEGARERG